MLGSRQITDCNGKKIARYFVRTCEILMAVQSFGKSSQGIQIRQKHRLAALERLDLLNSPRDEGFDRIVRLIQQVFTVEIGIVSLIDGHRQWYQACSGLSADEVPLEHTFCRYVLDHEEPMVVQDSTKDSRFAAHPAVTGDDHIRFYAGVPLKTKAGHTIGTVCAIDRSTRTFACTEIGILQELAGAAMDRIELMQTASTDSLTDALTRRAFKREAEQLVANAFRHKQDLACLVLDIDHFKPVNDTYGHAAGDEVLKAVVATCRANLRSSDLFGRLGGEEFAMVLPDIDEVDAMIAAERLNAAIAAQSVSGEFGTIGVTVSIGISVISNVGRDIETLLAQADAAMYHSKATGRNRCVSFAAMQGTTGVSARRSVLKAGNIVFDDRRSKINCTVRSIGLDSAGITVSNTAGIPLEFTLTIQADGFQADCRVVSRDSKNLEVVFSTAS
jgi:diguanylate cyclase (GGDEF)-like protein